MDVAAARRLQESYSAIFAPVVRRGAADPDIDVEGPQGRLLGRLADQLFDVERLNIQTPQDVAALLEMHSQFHGAVFESDDRNTIG